MKRISAILLLTLIGYIAAASAHPLAPALLELVQNDATHWSVLWRQSTRSTTKKPLLPQFPDNCESVGEPASRLSGPVQLETTWQLRCTQPGLTGQIVSFPGLEQAPVNVIVRLTDIHGNSHQTLLDGSSPTYRVHAAASGMQSFRSYIGQGAMHLIGGADHLLFLLALMILATGWQRLLWIITAFTLGHSLTLGLAVTGLLHIPGPLAEFLIAMTLVLTARELLCDRPTLLGRHLAATALLFGLVHGLGFAGSLMDIGVPRQAIFPALAGFNLGIELAQIGIATVFLAAARILPWLRNSALRPLPAYLIGSVAVLWCIERLLLMQEAVPALNL